MVATEGTVGAKGVEVKVAGTGAEVVRVEAMASAEKVAGAEEAVAEVVEALVDLVVDSVGEAGCEANHQLGSSVVRAQRWSN